MSTESVTMNSEDFEGLRDFEPTFDDIIFTEDEVEDESYRPYALYNFHRENEETFNYLKEQKYFENMRIQILDEHSNGLFDLVAMFDTYEEIIKETELYDKLSRGKKDVIKLTQYYLKSIQIMESQETFEDFKNSCRATEKLFSKIHQKIFEGREETIIDEETQLSRDYAVYSDFDHIRHLILGNQDQFSGKTAEDKYNDYFIGDETITNHNCDISFYNVLFGYMGTRTMMLLSYIDEMFGQNAGR